MEQLKRIIEQTWDNRELLKTEESQKAILQLIELLDKGQLRVAQPIENNKWQVNEWIKKGVILYFPISANKTEKMD